MGYFEQRSRRSILLLVDFQRENNLQSNTAIRLRKLKSEDASSYLYLFTDRCHVEAWVIEQLVVICPFYHSLMFSSDKIGGPSTVSPQRNKSKRKNLRKSSIDYSICDAVWDWIIADRIQRRQETIQNNKNSFKVSIQYQSSNVNDNLILRILKRGVMTFIGTFHLVSLKAYWGNYCLLYVRQMFTITVQAMDFLLYRWTVPFITGPHVLQVYWISNETHMRNALHKKLENSSCQ